MYLSSTSFNILTVSSGYVPAPSHRTRFRTSSRNALGSRAANMEATVCSLPWTRLPPPTRHKNWQQVVFNQVVSHQVRHYSNAITHRYDLLHSPNLRNLLLQVCHVHLFQRPGYSRYSIKDCRSLFIIQPTPMPRKCLSIEAT